VATHKVSVTVDETRIQVDPNRVVMSTQDEVHWQGTNPRKFSIVFEGGSPFGQTTLAHAAATSKQRPAKRGRFKYSVVSEQNPGLRLDPDIIVEDPPTENP